jgi:uncharacterized protein YdbL (DUF1318 family)
MRCRLGTLAASVALLAGCRAVPVHITTPEPLQVDVTVRMDIFQHKVQAAEDATTSAPTSDTGTSDEETRRRERMGQIQSFKNSRLVGENRNGLLTIIRLPPGEYGRQVEQVVAAENADRTELMRTQAAARRVPVATIEAEQAAQWRDRAFPGEWIEEQQADKTWRWAQKRAAETPSAAVEIPGQGAR